MENSEREKKKRRNILHSHCKETLIIDTFHVPEEKEAMYIYTCMCSAFYFSRALMKLDI